MEAEMDARQRLRQSVDSGCEAFIRQLLDRAALVRLPELFRDVHPDTLYQLRDREGVSVTALRTSSLDPGQLVKILTYRLAQYVTIDFVDRQLVYQEGLEHEPVESVAADDIHILAGAADTGELLCYLTIRSAPPQPPGATLRQADRPLFPVEKLFGHGVFNRLRILPDLPVTRVRELGRFVKNQRLGAFDERAFRAPIE